MSISSKIKALLTLKGMSHADLAKALGISPQALSNKFYRGSFSADDLIKIAGYCDCTLAFLSDDGNKITIDGKDLK